LDLWPAIDIRAGKCVRLSQGRFHAETEYGDPLEQAEALVAAGAERLHVVDLDAARHGGAPNRKTVLRIAEDVGVPVQSGGGVRDHNGAAALLDAGVTRVVVGTVAVERPELLAELVSHWPGRVLVGLDHRAGVGPDGTPRRELAVRGWVAGSGLALEAALERLEDLELGGVVVTAIERDGTGSGPDLDGLGELLGLSAQRVIASGGVATSSDIVALSGLVTRGHSLDGVIVGRALLSGALSVKEAGAACGP
jgi:phosphoribosylformimino-5-aminoimidazole carboxamide ribotide isomerase